MKDQDDLFVANQIDNQFGWKSTEFCKHSKGILAINAQRRYTVYRVRKKDDTTPVIFTYVLELRRSDLVLHFESEVQWLCYKGRLPKFDYLNFFQPA